MLILLGELGLTIFHFKKISSVLTDRNFVIRDGKLQQNIQHLVQGLFYIRFSLFLNFNSSTAHGYLKVLCFEQRFVVGGSSITFQDAFTLGAKQPKLDVIDNLRKVLTGRKLSKRLLNFT